MPRPPHTTELPLTVRKDHPVSLPGQLAEQLRSLILAGALAPADPLPSSRTLAERLGISRGSVVSAYEQLAGEGYIIANRSGTRVSKELDQMRKAAKLYPSPKKICMDNQLPHPKPRHTPAPTQPIDLTPAHPDTTLLATGSWRAAWRTAAAEPGRTFPAAGSPALQVQLAEHLRLMRSVVREPQEILISAGAREAFRLVLSVLHRQQPRRPLRIAVENPGYPSLHHIPAAFGHEILPVEVDRHGLNPAALGQRKHRQENLPDLVLVAPSHQYPLGASMPVARRIDLLNWATENNAYIIEDDYDSELRYVGDPLPALAALSRQGGQDRVITLGSFTKTLAPGLGLGYLLMPHELTEEVRELREQLGSPVSALVQNAMTNFLKDGGARRHIARMRRVYRARRNLLLAVLEEEKLPEQVRVLPMDGGLHAVIELGGSAACVRGEKNLQAAAAEKGVRVAALGDYWAHSGATENRRSYGLVVGFGALPEHRLVQGLKILGRTLSSVLCEKPSR